MSLKSLSPLDGRYASQTAALRDYFSEYALIRYRVRAEIEWLQMMAERPEISDVRAFSPEERSALSALVAEFDEGQARRVKEIERTTRHDVKAVEYYIRERLQGTGMEDAGPFIHFFCTSEDINNLAYGLMLKEGIQREWTPLAERMVSEVAALAASTGGLSMLARTHGQPATPTTVGKEMAVFVARWRRQLDQLRRAEYLGKFNGAVGNYNAHLAAYPDAPWEEIARAFVERLGLTFNPITIQIEPHDYMAEIFHQLIRFNTITLDFDRDVWSYISLGYFRQKVVSGETGSSVMPHKVNPIDFENSEANVGISNALLEHLALKLPVSRLQRDLTDSSALRNVGVAIGHSLLSIKSTLTGLSRLQPDPNALQADLADSWEILSEAIQTVLRKTGDADAYERLKELARGAKLTQGALQEFIRSLRLPAQEEERLLSLTPAAYTGLAERLIRHGGEVSS
jgi:adenylosuccinate lyase